MVRPLKAVQDNGPLQRIIALLPVEQGPGIEITAQQHSIGQYQNRQYPAHTLSHTLLHK